MSFFNKRERPFFILAPMEGITDCVFRSLVYSIAAPDLAFTEFTSVKGILSSHFKALMHLKLNHEERERQVPLFLQLWGREADDFYNAILAVKDMGFSGIDINMGCPKNKIIKKGVCGALIKDKTRSQDIIFAALEACNKIGLPLSIKTRLGFNELEVESWIDFLLSFKIFMLTINARLVLDPDELPPKWYAFKDIVSLKQHDTLIVGNGSIFSQDEALKIAKQYSLDGVMIARGILRNLSFFKSSLSFLDERRSLRIEVLKKYVKSYYSTWNESKDFNKLKKCFKIFFNERERDEDFFKSLLLVKNYEEFFKYLEEEQN